MVYRDALWVMGAKDYHNGYTGDDYGKDGDGDGDDKDDWYDDVNDDWYGDDYDWGDDDDWNGYDDYDDDDIGEVHVYDFATGSWRIEDDLPFRVRLVGGGVGTSFGSAQVSRGDCFICLLTSGFQGMGGDASMRGYGC